MDKIGKGWGYSGEIVDDTPDQSAAQRARDRKREKREERARRYDKGAAAKAVLGDSEQEVAVTTTGTGKVWTWDKADQDQTEIHRADDWATNRKREHSHLVNRLAREDAGWGFKEASESPNRLRKPGSDVQYIPPANNAALQPQPPPQRAYTTASKAAPTPREAHYRASQQIGQFRDASPVRRSPSPKAQQTGHYRAASPVRDSPSPPKTASNLTGAAASSSSSMQWRSTQYYGLDTPITATDVVNKSGYRRSPSPTSSTRSRSPVEPLSRTPSPPARQVRRERGYGSTKPVPPPGSGTTPPPTMVHQSPFYKAQSRIVAPTTAGIGVPTKTTPYHSEAYMKAATAARHAFDSINAQDIQQFLDLDHSSRIVKQFTSCVLGPVVVLMGLDSPPVRNDMVWATVVNQIANRPDSFFQSCKSLRPDAVSLSELQWIEPYITDLDCDSNVILPTSKLLAALCSWLHCFVTMVCELNGWEIASLPQSATQKKVINSHMDALSYPPVAQTYTPRSYYPTSKTPQPQLTSTNSYSAPKKRMVRAKCVPAHIMVLHVFCFFQFCWCTPDQERNTTRGHTTYRQAKKRFSCWCCTKGTRTCREPSHLPCSNGRTE
eukprot:TRINITY_DN50043_c0_g1_i1.p1 TRINITY_DN50043_c0_g1~~TRINITY_DN50043_c0_g1_i1.p1  ORF type:complete len:699 (+),score=94.09 TRINITY_DN50043_c0_g1_i1:279-2099(+)